METTVVIKVKFGDTLRRFNALVGGNAQMDLDMEKLRAKVLGLFNFALDADVTLTYIDEDGDVVTLVDDNDLSDAVRQNLNPLRINVDLKSERGSRNNARSSGSSTPLRSVHVQSPLQTGVSEVLKSVPEPLLEAISKLSVDMVSKAASSAPVLAELVESLSRVGQSYLKPNSPDNMVDADVSQFAADSSRQNGALRNPVSAPVIKKTGFVNTEVPVPEVFSVAKHAGLPKRTQDLGVGTCVTQPPASVDIEVPVKISPPGCGTLNVPPVLPNILDDESKSIKNEIKVNPVGAHTCSEGCTRSMYLGNHSECPFSGLAVANNSTMHTSAPPPFCYSKRVHNVMSGIPVFHRGVRCDGCGVHPITGPRFKSKVKEDYDLCNVCFAEMGNMADYIRMDRPATYGHPWPVKGAYDDMPGPRPPVLPHCLRGKTKSFRPKWDCRFVLDVNIMDGTVMAPSTNFTKIWRMRNNGNIAWPHGIQLVWIGGDRISETVYVPVETPPTGVPVDSELDVAVDFKAPQVPGRYVSYWMMSSPSGLKFGQRVWVLIQVESSLEGPLTESMHSLNLNSPPGCTEPKVSENLNSKVCAHSMDNSSPLAWTSAAAAADSAQGTVSKQPVQDHELLNFPIDDTLLVGSSVSDPAPAKVHSQVLPSSANSAPVSSAVAFPPKVLPPPVVSSKRPIYAPPQALQPPSMVCPPMPVSGQLPPAPVVFPQIMPSVISPQVALPPTAPSYEPSLVRNALTSSERFGANNDVEETLLKELEEMGFMQVDLNKEILRMNEFNLEQSVDDLCGVAEWDPILEELDEMGFCDKDMNRKLLKKNNGSIKGVVMDLIAGERSNPKEKTQ